MALIIRLDIDRPYGRRPLWRHCLSRLASDAYFPRIGPLGFLDELKTMLTWMNDAGARSYVFFRRCTLPSAPIMDLLDKGGHEIGLHLENSRSFHTFQEEVGLLEKHVQRPIRSFSKHGSGGAKFGYHHYAPYEADNYATWAKQASMRVFLGNLEDPRIPPKQEGEAGLSVFPAAFWLEPAWRDTNLFTVDWLLENAQSRDIVLLVHPENILSDAGLSSDFQKLIRESDSVLLS